MTTPRRSFPGSSAWAAHVAVIGCCLAPSSAWAQPADDTSAGASSASTTATPDAATTPEAPPAPESATASESDEVCMPICRPGFACVDGQCVSACNPPCVEGEVCTASLQCVPETDPAAGPPASLGMEQPEVDPDVTLDGVKGFGGIVLGGGISMHTWRDATDDQLDRPTTWGAFLFALRAGLIVARNEISVEFAPGTYKPTIGDTGDDGTVIDEGESVTSFLGSYAHHVPITLGAYWPFRFGAGFISRSHGGDFEGTDFQARVDLLNISVKTKFIFLDFSFPSIRYVSDFDAYHRWSGLFTAAVSAIGP